MRRTIAGFDPGTTVGLGILDLSGRVVFFGSFRNYSHDDVVRTINEWGKPVIIASDVSPAPEAVKKIAAAFDVEVFEPELSLTVADKAKVANGVGTKDAHQRDALAAAFAAEESYRSLIRRAKTLGPKWELGFELALKGKAPNLSNVFEAQPQQENEKFSLPLKLRLKIAVRENKRLRDVVNSLLQSIDKLREEKKEGERVGVSKPRPRSGELESTTARAEAAEKKAEAIERLLRSFEGKAVKVMKSGLSGDVIFVPRFDEAVEKTVDAKVVIAGKISGKPKYVEVVPLGSLGGLALGDLAIVPEENFPKAGKEWLNNIVKKYKDRL